jgi:predicted nucleotidyltransferase
VPRATVDVDLLVHLDKHQLDAFIERVRPDFYVSEVAAREAVTHGGMFNLIHLATGYKVDLHIAGDDPYEQTKLARARPYPLADGETLRLATPEDLVLSKLAWFRLGGERSERQWKDAQGILALNPDLDTGYMQRWADQLELSGLLRRALETLP